MVGQNKCVKIHILMVVIFTYVHLAHNVKKKKKKKKKNALKTILFYLSFLGAGPTSLFQRHFINKGTTLP